LDLPPTPLFQDHTGKRIIPQTSLTELLAKYDGAHVTSRGENEQTFELLQLPRYLILSIKRIIKTEFGVEKNRTVVNFGVKDLAIGSVRYNMVANISYGN
jgi:U4/U6.U5 tri-snRNP-associated protein 2